MGNFLAKYGQPLGTLGGAAVGTALAPGAGTMMGAQIGGMAGGAGQQIAMGHDVQNMAAQPSGDAALQHHAATVNLLQALLQQIAQAQQAQQQPPMPSFAQPQAVQMESRR